MKKNPNNEGIIQSGGTIIADQIAVGANAEVIKIVNTASEVLEQKGLQEIRNKLAELLAAVSSQANALKNRDEVLDSTKIVAQELSKEKPNKFTITAILDGIANGVKSIPNIIAIAQALKSAVEVFL